MSALRAGIGLAIVTAAACAQLACYAGSRPESIDAGRLGQVRRYAPDAPPRALVFLFSDVHGPNAALERLAEALARQGAATLLVDLRAYLKGLIESDDGCHYVLSELEELSKRQQHLLGAEVYESPILAGVGAGGTFAYAALAQSPAATTRAAVVVDPAPSLGTHVPFCEGAPSTPAKGGGFSYGPPTERLTGALRVAADRSTPDLDRWKAIVAAAPGARLEPPAAGGTVARFEALLGPLLKEGDTEAEAPALEGLPAVEIPTAEPGPFFAVIYSGDGGWRDLDMQIGEDLAAHGVHVIGIDSLRYFWRARTPEQVARDLARILEAEEEREGGPRQAILVGYSFGAGVLPFAVNRLTEDERKPIVLIALLGLESHAPFEFHLTGWLERPDQTELPVLPELKRMDLSKVQCFYGEDEDDTLCPNPEIAAAEIIRSEGGHHFDGDYTKIAERILEGARQRAGRKTGQRATTPEMPPEISAATSVSTNGTESPLGAAR